MQSPWVPRAPACGWHCSSASGTAEKWKMGVGREEAYSRTAWVSGDVGHSNVRPPWPKVLPGRADPHRCVRPSEGHFPWLTRTGVTCIAPVPVSCLTEYTAHLPLSPTRLPSLEENSLIWRWCLPVGVTNLFIKFSLVI